MARGPSDTILVAIRITLQIRESKARNPDPPDWRRFVLSECISCFVYKQRWMEEVQVVSPPSGTIEYENMSGVKVGRH